MFGSSAPSLPTIMNHSFSRVPGPEDAQRSSFDRSHGHKTTFDAGYLVPFFVDEAYPGDTYNVNATVLARLATPIFPLMDNLFLDTFWFFVPNRILWENWERFQGHRDDPTDSIDFEVPIVDGGTNEPLSVSENSLYDYMGIPVGISIPVVDCPQALPFRAYNLIWNEWFRDENLQNSVSVPKDDGPDNGSTLYTLLRRGKRHDYFTACLPWPQKGDAVSIPIGGTAPVVGTGNTLGLVGAGGTQHRVFYQTIATNGDGWMRLGNAGSQAVGQTQSGLTIPSGTIGVGVSQNATNSGLIAQLDGASSATINQLREAFAFQQVMERDARGGTRFVEILKSHWGVTVPDFRVQRPEYLGGSSTRIDIYGVPQTSSTDEVSPQGNLSAYGQVHDRSGFTKSVVEHGFIIGLVNVRADITYQQGLERFWSRRTRFDYYMPALAHLGEQAVYRKELYTTSVTADNNTVFGYQERWAELRYKPSRVSGLFRSAATGSLDRWHLAINFASAPVLNSAFIQDAPDVDRVIAVTTEPHILFDSYIKFRHSRMLPIYSVPGLQRL